jgi:hypothetical protein
VHDKKLVKCSGKPPLRILNRAQSVHVRHVAPKGTLLFIDILNAQRMLHPPPPPLVSTSLSSVSKVSAARAPSTSPSTRTRCSVPGEGGDSSPCSNSIDSDRSNIGSYQTDITTTRVSNDHGFFVRHQDLNPNSDNARHRMPGYRAQEESLAIRDAGSGHN